MNQNVLKIFSGSDVEGITALIKQMEKSPFDYLKIEGDGVKIVIGKNGVTDADTAVTQSVPAQAPAPPASFAAPVPAAEAVATPAAPVPAASNAEPIAVAEQPGIFIIKAPSYGMFYAQSDPTAPPYVTVGSAVKKGDTVGLLEIMKTFNAITSDVDGEVVAIHVKNEALLEPEQALFSVRVS